MEFLGPVPQNLPGNLPAVDLPWMRTNTFTADTTLTDKVCRIANIVIFTLGVCWMLGIARSAKGLAVYAGRAAMVLTLRKIVGTVIGHIAYPATLDTYWEGKAYYQELQRNGMYIATIRSVMHVQKITLYKSGTKYDAYLIGKHGTLGNGKWTLNALGNGMFMENSIASLAWENAQNGSNTLLINGPGVGLSGGFPTRYQMGAGFEAGVQFLEREVGATHIGMKGLSLGGGMLGEAILQHDFSEGLRKGIKYSMVSDRTFSTLSDIAGALLFSAAKPICQLAGIELDSMGGARKLSQLNIPHTVIQHTSANATGSDGVILDCASLATEAHKDHSLRNIRFIEDGNMRHNGNLPNNAELELQNLRKDFFNS